MQSPSKALGARFPGKWRGVATAGEPLVAIAFLQCGNVVQWYRSERGSAEKLELKFALLPYDAAGLDVQVNFSVGQGGGTWRSIVATHECVPVISDRREMQTGIIERFAEILGNPPVELSVLLIAREDVRSARNGLWRVRNQSANSILEPFQRILTYGRSGRTTEGSMLQQQLGEVLL